MLVTRNPASVTLVGARAGTRKFVSALGVAGRFARRKPVGAAGGFIVLAMIIIALAAPLISPHNPYHINATAVQVAPNTTFPLGTDDLGRDVLSRLMYGARISLYVGLGSVFIGVSFGFILGLVSGYVGGALDMVVQRVVDAFLAFPAIILAIALMGVLGSSVNNVIWAVSFVLAPLTSRTARAQVLAIKERDYILSAKAIGCTGIRTLVWHIAPSIIPYYIILATVSLGFAIIAEASLSFLGVGVPIDTPTWGGMLTGAATQHIKAAPWAAVSPGLAITLTVLAFNLLGDALRDDIDPRLRTE